MASDRKAMCFFDENDSGWNEVVDTRLADLRRALNASHPLSGSRISMIGRG